MIKGVNCRIDSNVFFSLDADVESARLLGGAAKWQDRGDYSHNVFANPYSPFIVATYSNLFTKKGKRTLEQWQHLIPGQADATNTLFPFTWGQVEDEFFEIDSVANSNLVVNGDFSNGSTGWNVTRGSGSVVNGAHNSVDGVIESDPISIGTNGATEYYRLRFTYESDEYLNLEFELTGAGQDDIDLLLYPIATEFEYFLKVDQAYSNAKLRFEADTTLLILDDISLERIFIDPHTPDCKSHLFTNWTSSPQTLQDLLNSDTSSCVFGSGWMDLAGQGVDPNYDTIPAYESRVFINEGEAIVTPPTGNADILLVVVNASSLTNGEQAIYDHLTQTMGHEVDSISDEVCQTSDAANYDLVIISGHTAPSKVSTKFRDVSTPVMLLRPQLLDEMTMGLSNGNTTSSDSLLTMDTTNWSHPMAAGETGTITVSSTGVKFGKINSGNLYPGAIQIAALPNSVAQVIFGYDTSPAGGGAGRRSAFFANMINADQLNSTGWSLFESTLCWTIGGNCNGTPTSSDLPPTACFNPVNGTTCTATPFDGSCSVTADPTDNIVSYIWDFGDNSANGSGVNPAHQYTSAGTYSVTLIVTDNNNLSDTVTNTVTIDASSTILVIVKDSSLTQAEQDLLNRLNQGCYTVQYREDDHVAAIATGTDQVSLSSVDLIILSAFCADSKISNHFANEPTPVLSLGPFFYDNLGMSLSNGTSNFKTDVYVVDPGSSLADGHPVGPVSIAPAGVKISWGTPDSSAYVALPDSTGNSTHASIFGYDTGAAMSGGFNAPARRTGFFINKNAFSAVNSNALDLLDQAVCWTMGICGSGSKQALFGGQVSDTQNPADEQDLFAGLRSNWTAYPNPTTGQLNIDFGDGNDVLQGGNSPDSRSYQNNQMSGNNCNLQFFNLQGQMVVDRSVNVSERVLTLNLSSEGLPSGMYLLKVQLGNETRIFRVVYRP